MLMHARRAEAVVIPQPATVRLLATGWTLPALAVVAACSLLQSGGLMQLAAAAGLVLLPGAVVLALIDVRPAELSMRIAAAASLGAVLLILSGALTSALGPHLGVDRPLDRPGVLVSVGTLCVLGTFVAARLGREPLSFLAADVTVAPRTLWPVGLAVAGIVGALRLASGHGSDVAVAAVGLCLVSLAGLLIVEWRQGGTGGRAACGSLLLYCATLGILWSTSLRGQHVIGWDIQQEHERIVATLSTGRWLAPAGSDPYGAMGSITALPAMLIAASGVITRDALRWFYPMFLAFVPVATWWYARRRVASGPALASALLLVGLQAATLRSLPAIGRQEIALCMFAVGLAVGFDRSVRVTRRRWFLAAMFAGLAFTHYSTAYAACLMLATAVVVGSLLAGRAPRREAVITWPVLAVVLVASVGWNLGLASSGDNLARVSEQLGSDGLQFLPGVEQGGLLQGWLRGTSTPTIDASTYEGLVRAELAGRLSWITPDASSSRGTYRIAPATVNEDSAAVTGIEGPWEVLRTVVAQGVVVTAFLSVCVGAALVWRRRRTGRPVSIDTAQTVAIGAGALLLGIALRTSGTLGEVYNPERAAVQAGVVLAPVVALALSRIVRLRLLVVPACVACVVVAALDGSGWATVLTGSGRPASLSAIGEDAERNVVNTAEVGTIEWLADTVPANAIVQSDRYGQMALANVDFGDGAALVDVVIPSGIDRSAWVYATNTNVVEGHARGAVSGEGLAVFEWPAAYLDATKSVVYSTGVTRVYR